MLSRVVDDLEKVTTVFPSDLVLRGGDKIRVRTSDQFTFTCSYTTKDIFKIHFKGLGQRNETTECISLGYRSKHQKLGNGCQCFNETDQYGWRCRCYLRHSRNLSFIIVACKINII